MSISFDHHNHRSANGKYEINIQQIEPLYNILPQIKCRMSEATLINFLSNIFETIFVYLLIAHTQI